jgi:hypothetical protein
MSPKVCNINLKHHIYKILVSGSGDFCPKEVVYADPKELKRQRDRERYAKNKDEILKRRRQSRELKKQSTVRMNDENMDPAGLLF